MQKDKILSKALIYNKVSNFRHELPPGDFFQIMQYFPNYGIIPLLYHF